MHRSLCLLGCLLPLHPSIADQDTVGLKVSLVSEVTHIQPGQPFKVGLFIHHEPDFHTYWKMPGIVGVPTSIQWTLPTGWTASELEFPEPERVLMYQIKAQGYERDVLLQASITPPADVAPGTTITLVGKAVWMCCAKSCHPGFKDLTLTLPIAESPAPNDSQWHPVFEQERAASPRPSPAWTPVARKISDTHLALTFTPTSSDARHLNPQLVETILFFTEDGWIDSDQPHSFTLQPDGSLLATLPLSDAFTGKSDPSRLIGILQLDGGWHHDGSLRSASINVPLE